MQQFKHIYVEISNVCNLKCSFCPEVERQNQKLTASDFASVLDKIRDHTESVYLHLMGEPLGHPEFGALIDLCQQRQVPVKLTTNGLLLVGKKKATVLKPIVKQINFSLHSFTDNFPGRSPQEYIGRLAAFAARALQEREDLYLNFRLWDLDEGQTGREENLVLRSAFAQAFAVDLEQSAPDIRRRKNLPLRGRQYVHFDSRFEWPSPSAKNFGTDGRCHGLSHHIGIHADGTVVPCCLDKEAVLKLGNIFEQDLETILATDRAVNMREGFRRGKLVEDLCQRCQFVTRFKREAKVAPASLSL